MIGYNKLAYYLFRDLWEVNGIKDTLTDEFFEEWTKQESLK